MNNLKRMLCKRLLLIFIISFSILGYAFSVASNTSQREEEHYLKKYNFTTDWFTHNIPVWEEVLSNFKGQPNIHYLEIGVFEGRSFLWVLENILTHPTSTATGIDPLYNDIGEVLFTNLKMSEAEDKAKIIRGFSQTELKDLPLNSFDIVYIDGDHKAYSVLADTVLSWSLLKKGGILIFDDYKLEMKKPPERRPQIAIDAFITTYRDYIDVIHLEYQCIIRKKSYIYWEKY